MAISPNGRYLAGATVQEGPNYYHLITFSMDLETHETTILNTGMRFIAGKIQWVGDERLLISHFGGHVLVDADGSNRIDLKGEDNILIYADVLDVLPGDPDHILMQHVYHGSMLWDRSSKFINNGKSVAGVYRVNIHTGEHEQIVSDQVQAIEYFTNRNGEVVLAVGNPDLDFERYGAIQDVDAKDEADKIASMLYNRAFLKNDDAWTPLDVPVAHDYLRGEFGFFSPHVDAEGKIVYLSNQERDRVVAKRLDPKTGEEKVLFEHPVVDVSQLVFAPHSGDLIGVEYIHDKETVRYFSSYLQGLHEQLQEIFPDTSIRFTSWSTDFKKFVFRVSASHYPTEYHLLDVEGPGIEEVYLSYPQLKGMQFTPSTLITFKARDGLTIYGYLTRPECNADQPGPMILLVHGGPFARDLPSFDRQVQFYADRGYTVLQVNYRGSTGYGRDFMLKGKRQQGLGMQDDLEDAVQWAVEQNFADPERIAIAGGSYGGYAAALALVENPEMFQLGIVCNGILDVPRQLQGDKQYGMRWIYEFYQEWWGDPENEEDLAQMKRLSPLRRVSEIKSPVFVYYGHRDRRVYPDQSMDFIRLLRRKDIPHDKFSKSFEGHSLGNPEHRSELFARIEEFLRENMPSDLMK